MSTNSTTTPTKSESTNEEAAASGTNSTPNGSGAVPAKSLNAKASEFVPSFVKTQGALKSTAAPFVPGGPAMGIPAGAAPIPIPMGVPMMQGAYPGAPGVMYMSPPPMMPPYVGGYMPMGNYPMNAGMPYPAGPSPYYGVPPMQQQPPQQGAVVQGTGGVVANGNSNKSAASGEGATEEKVNVNNSENNKGTGSDKTPQRVTSEPPVAEVVIRFGDVTPEAVKSGATKTDSASIDSVALDLAKTSLNGATDNSKDVAPAAASENKDSDSSANSKKKVEELTLSRPAAESSRDDTSTSNSVRNGAGLVVNTTTPGGYEGDADTEPNSTTSSPRPNSSSDDLAGQAKKGSAGWRGQTPKQQQQGGGNNNTNSANTTSGSGANSARESGRDANWRRGEVGAETVQSLLARGGKDGVTRYDKMALLNLFKRGTNSCPETFKGVFPNNVTTNERSPIALILQQQQQQQSPRGGKGGRGGSNRANKDPKDEPHPDEQIIFAKENMEKEGTFKYQPSRLQDTTSPEAILANAKLILNKLSLTNFDKLADEFMKVGVDSEELMGKAVEMIVVCAQMNEHFSNMYADLCYKITNEWSRGSTEEEESLGKSFRFKLLSRCQEEFAIDRVQKLEEIRAMDIPPEDKEERENILKKSYTGHMRFIGEIYMKGLVKANIMHSCVEELLQNTGEEVLVCLIKLLTTIGAELEKYDQRRQKKNVATYFKQIEKMAVEHPSSRMRYMLKDLVELRKNGWVARRETEKAKKLSDIRAEDSSNPSSAKSPRGTNSAAPSSTPRSQDARNLGSNRSSERAPEPAAAAAAPAAAADDWQTVSSSKKSGKGSGSAAASSGPSFGSTSGKGSGGGSFAALGGKKPAAAGGAGSKSSSNSGGSSSSNKDKNGGGRNDGRLSPRGGSGAAAPPAATAAAGEIKKTSAAAEGVPAAPAAAPAAAPSNGTSSNLPGANGEPVDKETLRRVRAAVEEYFLNGLDTEAVEVLKELVHPDGMKDVVKSCIFFVFEKKSEEREKLCALFISLFSSGFLTTEQAKRGVLAFLDEFDDIVIDVPLAGTYGAAILAHLVVHNVVDLSFLADVPSENMFSMSPYAAEFIGQTLKAITDSPNGGAERVEAAYRESGIKLLEKIQPMPKQSQEDAVAEFISKHHLTFLKA